MEGFINNFSRSRGKLPVSVSQEPEHIIGSNTKRNVTIHSAPAGTSTSEGVKSISREVEGPPEMAGESPRQGGGEVYS